MPGRLESISAQPVIREFAQGIAQDAVQPVAGFLAPTVPVSAMVGKYKKYTQKNRFRIPDTLRPVGGRAAELRFDVADETYNCQPHSLDYAIYAANKDDGKASPAAPAEPTNKDSQNYQPANSPTVAVTAGDNSPINVTVTVTAMPPE